MYVNPYITSLKCHVEHIKGKDNKINIGMFAIVVKGIVL